jgi:hypothetical protein
MSHRGSVCEAVGSACVGADVSTDRASGLAGWVRGEVQTDRAEFLRKVEVDDARADPHRPADGVDLTDGRESGENDKETWADWHRPTGETCPCSTGHDGDSVLVGQSDYRGNFLGGLWEDRGDDISRNNTRVLGEHQQIQRMVPHTVKPK